MLSDNNTIPIAHNLTDLPKILCGSVRDGERTERERKRERERGE